MIDKYKQVITPYGTFTRVRGDSSNLGSYFFNCMYDEEYRSLSDRVYNDFKRLDKCDSLEEVNSIIHSLSHKTTEAMTKGYLDLSAKCYKHIQAITKSFKLCED